MAKKKKTTKKKVAKRKTAKKAAIKARGTLSNAKTHKKNGDFAKGNKAAAGHKDPQAEMKKDFSRWFKEAVTKKDIQDIAKNLIAIATSKKSKSSVRATKEVLDRCMGKPPQGENIGQGDGVFKVQVVHYENIDDTKPSAEPDV
ncbi:MAG: hypothetical protein ACYTE8_03035 [Planctomycetota bacterium]|jgi:hypothetical protein